MNPSVKIVAISKPEVEGCETAEDFIAYAARVSNPANQGTTQGADKLVRYLIKNQHWSPFEMVSLTMEIVTTRDIARQILRHRSFSFQEFSQRYAKATNFVTREARLQDKKNRQNSIEFDDEGLKAQWQYDQNNVLDLVKQNYEYWLDQGIAKEQARSLLPEGMTESKLYMSGTLRSWIHYCQLRCGNGTQKEHKEIADLAWEEIGKVFPNIKIALTPTSTDQLVDDFAQELKEKLNKAREKYEYHDEPWKSSNWEVDFKEALEDHIQKGDPLDVAAYAAFSWHHGWSMNYND